VNPNSVVERDANQAAALRFFRLARRSSLTRCSQSQIRSWIIIALQQDSYLHAPEGVGRSKLAASSEKLLGVPMTDRNWRTVCKVMEMAGK